MIAMIYILCSTDVYLMLNRSWIIRCELYLILSLIINLGLYLTCLKPFWASIFWKTMNRLDVMLSVKVKVDYSCSTTSSLSVICIASLTILFLSLILYLQITLVSVNCSYYNLNISWVLSMLEMDID